MAGEGSTIGGINVKIGANNDELVKKLNESSAEISRTFKQVGDFNTSIGEMRKEYKLLSKTSLLGKTPEEIKAIQNRMAELKDGIGDYQARINSLSLDPFQKMAQGIQVTSSMMAGLSGAVAMFGGENEKMQEMMQKTVSLMAIAQAAQTAADFTKQNAIGIFLKEKTKEIALRLKEILTINSTTAANAAEAGAVNVTTTAKKAATVAQRLWNAAVNAFPAMAIITAVAAIGAGIALLVRSISSHNKEIKQAQQEVDGYRLAVGKLIDANKYEMDIMQASGVAEGEIRKERNKQIQAEIAALEKQRDALQKLQEKQSGKKERAKILEETKKINEDILALSREFNINIAKQEAEARKIKEEELRKQVEINRKKLEEQRKLNEKMQRVMKSQLENSMVVRIEPKLSIKLPDLSPVAEKLNVGLENVNRAAMEKAQALAQKITDINEVVSNAITELAVNGTSMIADAIGSLAAGADVGDVFKNVAGQLVSFMDSLGKSLIAAGIGALAFGKLLKHPGAAIAAGAALVALAAFVRTKLAAGPAGGGGGMAATEGGGGGGGYSSPSTASSPNYTEWSNRTVNAAPVVISGELRASGSELVAVISSENRRREF
ncbi:MAG TPA: hypothetical protein PKL74_10255 [Tenuifilaceae bacterium]|nr:hypothetical protein [Tenuifilaceae bacterium]